MAGPFVTATEFCEWTGFQVPDDLTRLQTLLNSASSLIRGFTGQTLSEVTGDVIVVQPEFDKTTGVRNLPPRASGGVIELPETPVTEITEILVDAVAFTDFTFNRDGFVQRTDRKAWEDAATITYKHGYTETSEEFERIKSVCIEAVKRAYTGDETGQALSQGGFPVETVGFPTTLFLTQANQMDLMGLGKVGVG